MNEWRVVLSWLLGPPTAAVMIIVLGDLGAIGWPPPPTDWVAWVDATDPAVSVVATLRAAAMVACATTSLRAFVAVVDVLSAGPGSARLGPGPASLRQALHHVTRRSVAIGLGVSLVSSAAGAGAQPVRERPEPRSETDSLVPSMGALASQTVTPVPSGSYAELRRVSIEIAPAVEEQRDRATTTPDLWVVEPGDHLWGIASEILTEELGEPPSERRVRRYWRRLIDANADRFVIPGEPDVIWPGQRLVLPALGTPLDQRSGT